MCLLLWSVHKRKRTRTLSHTHTETGLTAAPFAQVIQCCAQPTMWRHGPWLTKPHFQMLGIPVRPTCLCAHVCLYAAVVCVCVCVQSAVHVINGVILPNLNATTNSTRPAGKPLWLASRARNHALASKLRAITTHKGTHSTHTGFGTLCGMAREVTGWVLARTSAPNRTK